MDGTTAVVQKFSSVNKQAYKKKLKDAICLSHLSSKKVKNNSILCLNLHMEENLAVNNKDNRVFMSQKHQSDSCPLGI